MALSTLRAAAMTCIILLGVTACGQSGQPAGEAQAVLPVSLNEVMVALVNHSADPIWVAAWKNPQSEEDWRELERLAYQIEIAGLLLTMPGTGPMDREWVTKPGWQRLSIRLSQVGKDAVAAARTKDLEAISKVGDELVEVCEACHIAFKPAQPTGGKYGELSPTEADLADN